MGKLLNEHGYNIIRKYNLKMRTGAAESSFFLLLYCESVCLCTYAVHNSQHGKYSGALVHIFK